jgi:folate-dependent phosphoribosylglycinamide formyltransferase PurN
MEKQKKGIKLALIASGGGTDANSIMEAWKQGSIPEVNEVVLISTKENAGCISKAEKFGIPTIVEDYDTVTQNFDSKKAKEVCYLNFMKLLIEMNEFDLVFLVGCIKRMPVLESIPTYNIHPADPFEHGGDQMYGLDVHIHVLNRILDQIRRGWFRRDEKIYTTPTVHSIYEEYDQGQILMKCYVEIPEQIIKDLFDCDAEMREIADDLQKHVLPYEWLMLPTAVRIAAKQILDKKG